MIFTLMMVLYVVLAVFMIGFILIQRGAGAAAGSGFGGGASATVFGARGASSFLTKATKWLAIAFFVLTLGMAIYIQRTGLVNRTDTGDLGVMSGVEAPAAQTPPPVTDVPSAGAPAVSTAPAASDVPVPADDSSSPATASEDASAVPEETEDESRE